MPLQSVLSARKRHGFTLIELLVVIFIIGLIGGYAVLNIGSGGGREMSVKFQAERLQGLIALALQEAVIQGQPIGLQFESSGYRFLIPGTTHWQEITDISALRMRNLPSSWNLSVVQAGHLLPLAKFTSATVEEKSMPQIIFHPSGEHEPFEISLMNPEDNSYFHIVSTSEGTIQLLEEEGR